MLSSPATTARSGTGGGSGGSRLGARRGSAYMDYESTVLALVEAQEGLKRVQLQLQVTEVKHSELKTRYSDLSTKFSTIQSEAIDTS